MNQGFQQNAATSLGLKSANPPRIQSGVELLNTGLNDLRGRIWRASARVSELANQFGAPNVGNSVAPAPECVSTNDFMAALDTAMRELEASISRIDNQ